MVVKADKKDIITLAKLAVLLWSDCNVNDLINDFSKNLSNNTCQFFLKYENCIPVGFAQCGLRYDYVEGTETSPVGYLEGIYVKENFRKKGYGRQLLENCELWAKSNGCVEFASDCELSNINSCNFHKAMNFEEANKIICFTKKL